MRVAARSGEHESRRRPFPGARPRRRGQWTAGARRTPIVFMEYKFATSSKWLRGDSNGGDRSPNFHRTWFAIGPDVVGYECEPDIADIGRGSLIAIGPVKRAGRGVGRALRGYLLCDCTIAMQHDDSAQEIRFEFAREFRSG